MCCHMRDEVFRHFTKCPLCESPYRTARFSVLQQEAERTLVHVTCPSCKTGVLLSLLRGESGTMCVGGITDLHADEAHRAMLPSLTPNEVLDVYTFLNTSDITLMDFVQSSPSAARTSK